MQTFRAANCIALLRIFRPLNFFFMLDGPSAESFDKSYAVEKSFAH